MKIWINGIIRDMTEEEEAEYIAEHEHQTEPDDPDGILNILTGVSE